jgi:hypothetical protein
MWRIRNNGCMQEDIGEQVRVAPISGKDDGVELSLTIVGLFGRVWRRLIQTTVKRVD